ncbi:MAG: XRE family transcriptional regulator [Phycisphaerae bacterium]|nr:XRE family transcriptional regulator [Phycisphaerae bacterium]
MAKRTRTTSDAVKILHRRYVKGDARRLASLESERERAAIAAQIYDLRNKAGLTQKQLADLVGTTQSVVSRLEDADYGGHTLSLLERIASALHCRVEVRLLPDQAGYAFASS